MKKELVVCWFLLVCSIFAHSETTHRFAIASQLTVTNHRTIYVRNGYLYVDTYAESFKVFNVSDIANSHEVGFSETTGSVFGIHVDGTYAYSTGMRYLEVFDVSTPELPVRIADEFNSNDSTKIFVSNNYVYIYDESFISIYDISNPADPVEAAGTVPIAGCRGI